MLPPLPLLPRPGAACAGPTRWESQPPRALPPRVEGHLPRRPRFPPLPPPCARHLRSRDCCSKRRRQCQLHVAQFARLRGRQPEPRHRQAPRPQGRLARRTSGDTRAQLPPAARSCWPARVSMPLVAASTPQPGGPCRRPRPRFATHALRTRSTDAAARWGPRPQALATETTSQGCGHTWMERRYCVRPTAATPTHRASRPGCAPVLPIPRHPARRMLPADWWPTSHGPQAPVPATRLHARRLPGRASHRRCTTCRPQPKPRFLPQLPRPPLQAARTAHTISPHGRRGCDTRFPNVSRTSQRRERNGGTRTRLDAIVVLIVAATHRCQRHRRRRPVVAGARAR